MDLDSGGKARREPGSAWVCVGGGAGEGSSLGAQWGLWYLAAIYSQKRFSESELGLPWRAMPGRARRKCHGPLPAEPFLRLPSSTLLHPGLSRRRECLFLMNND